LPLFYIKPSCFFFIHNITRLVTCKSLVIIIKLLRINKKKKRFRSA